MSAAPNYSSSFRLGVPNLPAYAHAKDAVLYVWCKHGQTYHGHGIGSDGLRSSHCRVCKQASGEGYDSYHLVYVGEMPDALLKDVKLKRPKGPAAFGYPEEFVLQEVATSSSSVAP
jgi:hypothetical protein